MNFEKPPEEPQPEKAKEGSSLEKSEKPKLSWEEVRKERHRKAAAEYYELPEGATEEDIEKAREESEEKQRKSQATELGLKEDTSWEEIRKEQGRIEYTKEFDLPEDSSWEEVEATGVEKIRQEEIKKLGLSEKATWTEVEKAFKKAKPPLLMGEPPAHPSTGLPSYMPESLARYSARKERIELAKKWRGELREKKWKKLTT